MGFVLSAYFQTALPQEMTNSLEWIWAFYLSLRASDPILAKGDSK
jgi:hypothetical protein